MKINKSKKTILFLHAALGVSKDLSGLMQILEEMGHKVLAFDFSGHGLAAKWPDEFRIDLFARELDKYLKTHQLENVAIFGHSMGGYVALYHKATYEDTTVTHIITYGTKFNWSQQAVAKELPMLDPDYLMEKYPQFTKILAEKHGERWKALLRSTAHMMQNLEKLDGLTAEDLHEIKIPVTLVLGDQDKLVSLEETHLATSRLPKAQFKALSHSKHELEKSNLKELAQIIIDSID